MGRFGRLSRALEKLCVYYRRSLSRRRRPKIADATSPTINVAAAAMATAHIDNLANKNKQIIVTAIVTMLVIHCLFDGTCDTFS